MSMESLLLSLQARIVRPEVLSRYDSMLRSRDYRRAAENPNQLMPILVRPRPGVQMPGLRVAARG